MLGVWWNSFLRDTTRRPENRSVLILEALGKYLLICGGGGDGEGVSSPPTHVVVGAQWQE